MHVCLYCLQCLQLKRLFLYRIFQRTLWCMTLCAAAVSHSVPSGTWLRISKKDMAIPKAASAALMSMWRLKLLQLAKQVSCLWLLMQTVHQIWLNSIYWIKMSVVPQSFNSREGNLSSQADWASPRVWIKTTSQCIEVFIDSEWKNWKTQLWNKPEPCVGVFRLFGSSEVTQEERERDERIPCVQTLSNFNTFCQQRSRGRNRC